MDAHLVLNAQNGTDSYYVLDPQRDNQIGRGLDCQIVLADPLASRVHAIIWLDEGNWRLRDADSRNGTYANDQRIDDVLLTDGFSFQIGQAEFVFRLGHPPEIPQEAQEEEVHQTVVVDTPIQSPMTATNLATDALRDPQRAQDLLDLYQLSIWLLGCSDPDDVIRESLELLHQRTNASVVGFLWLDDRGRLQPKLVIPESARGSVALSGSLTDLVLKKGHAVWANNKTGHDPTASLRRYADAICVPLIRDDSTLGAIHLYLEQGEFRRNDFEVAVSVANILVVALAKARQLAALKADHERLVNESAGFDELIGESQPMQQLKSRLRRIARASGCVLIRGESGAGKELVARAIHRASPREDRPLLSVNCAAIPPDLMESQLFGHKKGAFTGADADHVGWFQQADSGTLFLDEVGEMTLEGQAKLLRILEGHPFLPVGAQQEVRVDVRVLAATNRSLREFVSAGKFREDLYYRLSVFELHIPPLRERGEDIERLVQFFLGHFTRQHGRPDLGLSSAAREKLLAYAWPGNVRQLRNVIDSAVVLAEENEIEPHDLGLHDAGGEQLETLRFDYWERKLIQQALDRTGSNVPEAAKLLGIGRATLYRKIDEYGIAR
jgi:Nif-specific regulatory protein